MALTTGDIEAIKKALQPDFKRIDKRLDSLEKKIATLEETLTKKIDQLRVDVAMSIGEMVENLATRTEVNELRKQIATKEFLKKTAYITRG